MFGYGNIFNMKKNDIILALIITVIGICGCIALFAARKNGEYITISIDGKLTDIYSLNETQDILITDEKETFSNYLVIRNGMADMTESDCPDALCVHQRAISKSGENIVCLPHKLIVTVTQNTDAGYTYDEGKSTEYTSEEATYDAVVY